LSSANKGMSSLSVRKENGQRQQKNKADPAPKNEAAAKNKSTSGEDASKAEGGETAAVAPSNYSRGEGQKLVTTAYKENWNAICAKKKKR
jgi:hypothetical protein